MSGQCKKRTNAVKDDLYFSTSEAFIREWEVLEDDEVTPINLTGKTFSVAASDEDGLQVFLATSAALTGDRIEVNAGLGIIRMVIENATSSLITPGYLNYELIATDGDPQAWVYGQIEVEKGPL
jgi:hypothetical protein